MSNEDVMRKCESQWLDPDYSYKNYKADENDEPCLVVNCEFCDRLVYEHEILNVGGFKICLDCAEEIIDAWNKKLGR